MPERIRVGPEEMGRVRAILQDALPGRTVWAFGSRVSAQARARQHSDLDLAVLGPRLPIETMARVREAFGQSPLPFAVDVVEWEALPASLRASIERDHAVVQEGT